ncbi:hypothetical protein [Sphingomonas sp. SFZ2018-12]|nr:hypothetical protein [Sphingomonas sp. SFZ2018-12]
MIGDPPSDELDMIAGCLIAVGALAAVALCLAILIIWALLA